MSETTFGLSLFAAGFLASLAIIFVSRLTDARASRQWVEKTRRE
jgi:hypothetical protein